MITHCRYPKALLSAARISTYCLVTALASLAVSNLSAQTVQGSATAVAPLANAVVLIIRHGEKPAIGLGLATAGQQRATAYVRYFQEYKVDSRARPPDYLAASADTHGSERERLTLTPLSQALHVPIDTRFQDKDVASFADALTTQTTGKTILICWHHEEIPALLQSLGVDPGALLPGGVWPGSVYDWVVELRYDANGHLLPHRARRVSEHLLPSDTD